MEHADVAPMIAALLGIPIPPNARGQIPLKMLSLSDSQREQLASASVLQRRMRLHTMQHKQSGSDQQVSIQELTRQLEDELQQQASVNPSKHMSTQQVARQIQLEQILHHIRDEERVAAAGQWWLTHSIIAAGLFSWQIVTALQIAEPHAHSDRSVWSAAAVVAICSVIGGPKFGCGVAVVCNGILGYTVAQKVGLRGLGLAIAAVVLSGAAAVSCGAAWFKQSRWWLAAPWIIIVGCVAFGVFSAAKRSSIKQRVVSGICSLVVCWMLVLPLDDERHEPAMVAAGGMLTAVLAAFGWLGTTATASLRASFAVLLCCSSGLAFYRPADGLGLALSWIMLTAAVGLAARNAASGSERLVAIAVAAVVLQVFTTTHSSPC